MSEGGSYFTLDGRAFLLLLAASAVFYLWNRLRNKAPISALNFSSFTLFKDLLPSLRASWASLPSLLKGCALGFFILAFLDPRMMSQPSRGTHAKKLQDSKEGLAIYLLLDQSGSMSTPVALQGSSENDVRFVTKVELLKEFTRSFIEERPNDLLGLVAFARVPQILSPLTLDHQALLEKLSQFGVIQNKEYDGTGIGYAIYKVAHIISAMRDFTDELRSKGETASYDMKGAFMIVVTDGFQEPNPLDQGDRLRTIGLDEASDYAKKQNIRLYIINIDPAIKNEEFAPQRHLMERVAGKTGGQFFTVDEPSDLAKVYTAIDTIEKSKIQAPPQMALEEPVRRFSFYPYLLSIGLALLFLGILLETTIFRRVP